MAILKDSFTPGETGTGPNGQRAHPASIEHNHRVREKLYKIGEHAWCHVGNGLSNQTFIKAPEGLIAIDTGESIEEMEAALTALRKETDVPVVACIYTHFHYVGGTSALLKESGNNHLPIYGHRGIEANKRRFGGEVGPRGARGLVHQFGITLPVEGPDGLLNVGLGRFFRNPGHAPFTTGYIPPEHTFDEPAKFDIAGLEVEMLMAPSDASDSITIWFPQLSLAVNNLLWPALFNVFAIRGEEYRDPRVLLKGLDELEALGASYLLGAHGPPLEGKPEISDTITDYRDSIQFLWDQTVRGANLGLTLDELISFVQLPAYFSERYHTTQLYGLAEHHVRQIYNGLFGWFDEDEAKLFPTPAPLRAQKLIAGFGGKTNVRQAIDEALADQDYRWAIELATWLVRCETNNQGRADAGEQEDRNRLAAGLRGVAHSTTSANIRNWCLTRCLELEGANNLDRFRGHRFRTFEVAAKPAADSVPILKVLLVPNRAVGIKDTIRFNFDDNTQAGLQIRNQVAIPTDGSIGNLNLQISHEHWSLLLGGKAKLSRLLDDGEATATPDRNSVERFLTCFDIAAFQPSD